MHTAFYAREHGFRFPNHFAWLAPTGRFGVAWVYGLCGGMCFAALDYYYAARSLPTQEQPPAKESRLLRYLWRRQVDSLHGLHVPLRTLVWMVRSDAALARVTWERTWPALRDQLLAGRPTVLCLIRARGWQSPTHNHQVTALGYTQDSGSGQVTISLYDPNTPCHEPTLALYPPDTRTPPLEQSTGEALRGFFLIPYTPRLPPEGLV